MSQLIEHVSEFGLNRANPYARPENNLKLVDPNDPGTAGQDTLATKTGTDALLLKTVTFDGTVYAVDPMIVGNDRAAIFKWLLDLISKCEVDPYLVVTYDAAASGTLDIMHIGAKSLELITFDDDSTIAVTRVTTIKSVCVNSFMFVDDPGDFSDGTAAGAALANAPYAYTGVPATDTATAAQLKTDIEAYFTTNSTDYESVTTYPNNVEGMFTIEITAEKGVNVFTLDASAFTVAGCKDIFG